MPARLDADRTGGSGSRPVADVQRRTVTVLATSQMLGGIGVASGIAVGGLLAEQVSGSTALSGLASTATVLGAALVAMPLARLTATTGRRRGLTVGWGLGAVGAGTVLAGAVLALFPLLLGGMLLFGAATAANLQARFAATDLAVPAARARSLGLVVWATTVGAVLGPNLTGPGARTAALLGLPDLAGPFVFSVAAFTLGALVIAVLLRPDPLLLARATRGAEVEISAPPRVRAALTVVRRSPRATLGLAAVVLAHTVMVAVMTMTPVHMSHGGAALTVVGLVISGHIAGMYALSPLVGWAADRLGRVPVLLGGQVVLLAALGLSGLASDSPAALGGGLFLLGLGWSGALVAGSTLLSEAVPVAHRPGVQGTSDLLMNLAGAGGGAASGVLLGWVGYGGLAAVATVLLVPVPVLALRRRVG